MVEATSTHAKVMLLTTASVHSGCSGGAVVDADGRLVGLVTGNAQRANGVTIPQLNFSLPVEVLQPLLEFASRYKCGDHQRAGAILNAFNVSDPEVAKIWRLQGGPKLPTIKSSAVGNCEQQRLNRQGIRDDKPREQKTKSTDSACVSQTYLQSVRGFVSLDNQPAKNDSRMIRDQYTDISNHRTPRSHSKL